MTLGYQPLTENGSINVQQRDSYKSSFLYLDLVVLGQNILGSTELFIA
jgi:hypothetical protein